MENTVNQTMKSVLSGIVAKYAPTVLVHALKANKEAHVKEYTEALSAWEKEVEETYKKAAKTTRAAIKNREPQKIFDAYSAVTLVNSRKPVNRSDTYDNYIVLFSRTSHEDIELTLDDANCIINDVCDCATSAKTINQYYTCSNSAGK